MVAIAHSVGVATTLGQFLLYAAPAFSVIAGSVLYIFMDQLDWYARRWQIKRAMKTLEKSLRNPNFSEEHKEGIRKTLEEIHATFASSELERIKLLSVAKR